MNTFSIIMSLLGTLGIGSGIWSILDKKLAYRLDKKKIFYDKKFEAYNKFAKFSLGFNVTEQKEIFEAMASTSEINLLTNDDEILKRINNFIIDLDAFNDLKIPTTEKHKEEYYRLQKESKKIVQLLREDLKNTFK